MICGIVLAAGRGRRIGTPKALLRLHGETFHERALALFQAAEIEVVVVTSAEVDRGLPAPMLGEWRVLNPNPDDALGMFGSVKLGVAEALRRSAAGALLLPVDHPLASVYDLRAVRDGLLAGAAIVVASHEGRRGHPVGLSRPVMEEIGSDPSARSLRDIVRREPARVVEVPASVGATLGVNTEEDLKRVSNLTFR